MSFAENATQRLDTAKFPRTIGERKRERESSPAAFPWIPLIWSYGPCLVDLNHHFHKRAKSTHCIHRRCQCLD